MTVADDMENQSVRDRTPRTTNDAFRVDVSAFSPKEEKAI